MTEVSQLSYSSVPSLLWHRMSLATLAHGLNSSGPWQTTQDHAGS
jgi:hypothetical protein